MNERPPIKWGPMVRVVISAKAFNAIRARPPLGNVFFERALTATGERYVWIERLWLNKITALRGPGESYSDVILRLVESEARGLR